MIKTTTTTEINIGPLFAREDVENNTPILFHNETEWRAFAEWFRRDFEDLAAEQMWPVIEAAVKRWLDR